MILRYKNLLKSIIVEVLSILQYLILFLSSIFFKIFTKKQNGVVIGVSEISKFLYLYGKVLPDAKTVCLNENKFYQFDYNYQISNSNKLLYFLKKLIYAPILLAYLSSKNHIFIYLWSTGFILNRKYDFYFLKRNDKKIINIFLGDDIRSPKKLKIALNKLGYEGFIESVGIENPFYLSIAYERQKIKLAKLADKYADLYFSYPIDQASYLKKNQYPVPYIYLKSDLNFSELKFANVNKYKIIHAPSNASVKGTPLVREAIERLRIEGYVFEYKELFNVDNKTLMYELRESHIVLNQFHTFVPGMFGIESMANHCAVLMSADPKIEKNLHRSAIDAWMVTTSSDIYKNLKYLLDNKEEIKRYADSGYYFVENNYTEEYVNKYLATTFQENGIKI